jgi:small subunit ribosomal protein S6
MTVFLPDLPEEDNQAQLDRVSGYLTSAGGSVKEVLTESPWGRRRLAYAIRFNNVDFRDGFFTVYHFDAAPSVLTEIERDLKLDTSTMRYLLVHDDPKAGEKFPQQDQEGAETQGDATEAPARSNTRSRAAEPAATAPTAADDASAETLTDDAVSAEDEPATEPAPEHADPESTLVPESEVVSTEEPEGETAPESTDDAESELVSTEEPEGEPASESNDDEPNKE